MGLNPVTGRPRIDKEVLEGMRQYLLVADRAERIARKERIKKSLEDLKLDPLREKTMMRLEPAPLVSSDMSKGKGVVFHYENQAAASKGEKMSKPFQQVLEAGSQARKTASWSPMTINFQDMGEGSVSISPS